MVKNKRYISYNTKPKELAPLPLVEDGLITSSGRRNRVKAKDIVVLLPDRNTGNKRDYSGAFRPEATRFSELHGIPSKNVMEVNIAQGRYARAEQAIDFIENHSPKIVVFFCHGYSTGMQFGIRSPKKRRATKKDKDNFDLFADALSARTHNPHVVLYACSTGDDIDGNADTAPGSGDDSFSDLLRDKLCTDYDARYNRVFAHTTAGHATRNPYVKFFEGKGSPIGKNGADLIVKPGTREFRTFRNLLWKDRDFRFRIPFMTVKAIHEIIDSHM